MIWRSLYLFLILFIAVYVGSILQHHTGYLLISLGRWSIETSLWVAIPALFLFIFCLNQLIALCHYLANLPKRWHHWRTHRRLEQAQAQTRLGLIEFSEGHWQRAKKHLINALPDADTPLLNYLTAARAAQELGDNAQRDDYLRQAQQSMPEAKIAVELTQAQLQLANQQWEQARATLKHLQDLTPNHPYVLKLLMQLYEAVHDWPQLILLLPQLKRHHVIEGILFEQKQQQYYVHALGLLIQANQAQAIQDFIKHLPKPLKHDGDLSAMHARYLLSHQQEKQAENVLRQSLKQRVNEPCLTLYGMLPSEVVDLRFIESLANDPTHAASFQLCLGRLCSAKQLWAKARSHFEQSITHHPSAEAYYELGNLFEKTQQATLACEAYKKGVLLHLGGFRG